MASRFGESQPAETAAATPAPTLEERYPLAVHLGNGAVSSVVLLTCSAIAEKAGARLAFDAAVVEAPLFIGAGWYKGIKQRRQLWLSKLGRQQG